MSPGGPEAARRWAYGLDSHVENGASVYLAGAGVKEIASRVTNRDKRIFELIRK